MKGKRILAVLLLLGLILGLMPSAVIAEGARETVSYVDEHGNARTCSEYTVVTASTTTWSNGWYVVNSTVNIGSRVKIVGTAYLILCDGAKLTIDKGINVPGGCSFYIYAQNQGTGVLSINNTNDNAGIGGNSYSTCGDITINGGNITSSAGTSSAGIGGGRCSSSGIITINAGTVISTGGKGGAAAIGGGTFSKGTVRINGGYVKATAQIGGIFDGVGAAIGGGESGGAFDVTITGGTVYAIGVKPSLNSGAWTSAIGGGTGPGTGTVTITGGSVRASGENAIAGGRGSKYSILGGNFTSSAPIGAQDNNCTITLGWTNLSDSIKASQYQGQVYFSRNLVLSDSRVLATPSNINGKTLVPSMTDYSPCYVSHYGGHTYRLIYSSSGWEDMKTYCEGLGGHLATITTAQEDAFLWNLAQPYAELPIFFGYTDAGHEGSWVWTNGEISGYTNWKSGEPNDTDGQEHWSCYIDDGLWNDFHNVTTGCYYICEWDYYLETFDRMSYHANWLLENDLANGIQSDIHSSIPSPSEWYVQGLETDMGMDKAACVWQILDYVSSGIDDITSLGKAAVKNKDLYTAILLEMLQADSSFSVLQKDFARITKDMSKLESTIVANCKQITTMETFDFYRDRLNDLPEDVKNQVLTSINKDVNAYFKAEYPGLALFDIIGDMHSIAGTLDDYLHYLQETYTLVTLSDSLKGVVNRLYRESLNTGNISLQLALLDLVNIVNLSPSQIIDKIMADTYIMIGNEVVEYTVKNVLWKPLVKELYALCPAVGVIQTAYKTGKYAANAMNSVDATINQYLKMKLTVEVEELLKSALDHTGAEHRASGSPATGTEYIDLVNLFYTAREMDCDYAIKFNSIVDDTNWRKLKKELAWLTNSHIDTLDELTKYFKDMKSYYASFRRMANTGWVTGLVDDYPDSGLLEQYAPLLGLQTAPSTSYTATNANAYVYDRNDTLVGYVTQSQVYSEGSVLVGRLGTDTVVNIPDGAGFHVVFGGVGISPSDITVEEHNASGEVTRTTEFYQESLTQDTNYSVEKDGVSGGYNLRETSTGTIRENTVDSASINDMVYTLTVNCGMAVQYDTGYLAMNIPAGARVSLYAVLPDNFSFTTWQSDTGESVFDDPYSVSTTLTMPAHDLSVTANGTLNTDSSLHDLTVIGGYGSGSFHEGDHVTVIAQSALEGMDFLNWEGSDGLSFLEGSSTTGSLLFTMPGTDLTLSATYTEHVHNYDVPIYEWSEDLHNVTAVRMCRGNPDHTETETVETTVLRKDATCEEAAEVTYTATFENEAFAEQTKTETDGESLGHDYDFAHPVWIWASDHSGAAVGLTCQRCGKAWPMIASVSCAENDGIRTFTAEAVFELDDGTTLNLQDTYTETQPSLPAFTIMDTSGSLTADCLTVTDPENGILTVSYPKACILVVRPTPEGDYIRIPCTAIAGQENSYSFDLSAPGLWTAEAVIIVGVKGDVNGDGKINVVDATRVKSASISKYTFSPLEFLFADVNGDGKINVIDATRVKSASISKYTFSWDLAS